MLLIVIDIITKLYALGSAMFEIDIGKGREVNWHFADIVKYFFSIQEFLRLLLIKDLLWRLLGKVRIQQKT
jgi:hypothetical protein